MILGILILGIFFLEWFIKSKADKSRKKSGKSYWKGYLTIEKFRNYGMAGSRGSAHPRVVMTVSSLVTALVSAYVWKSKDQITSLESAGWGLILGGACSNLADRIKRGYVVDYLRFPKAVGKCKDYIYNLSDLCIFLGSFFVLLGNIRGRQ